MLKHMIVLLGVAPKCAKLMHAKSKHLKIAKFSGCN